MAGTLFQDTKLPLATWFLAIHLLTSTKTNMAALELMQHLGVCYRTAWRLKHTAMRAMIERGQPRQLEGFVQADDAYLGGERNGGTPGRGSENKQPFLIAVETDAGLEHPRYAVIEPLRSFGSASIDDWKARRLKAGTEIDTDGLRSFRRVAADAHLVLVTDGSRAATEAQGARWVNMVLSNVKHALDGVYYALKQNHYAQHYPAEGAYRFDRRFRLVDMVPRLTRAMAICKRCSERVFRLAEKFSD